VTDPHINGVAVSLGSTPILFLPGSWHGAWCWNEVIAHLVPYGRPALAVDMARHGLRARRSECLTMRPFDPAALATEVSPVATVDLDHAADLLGLQMKQLGRGGPVNVTPSTARTVRAALGARGRAKSLLMPSMRSSGGAAGTSVKRGTARGVAASSRFVYASRGSPGCFAVRPPRRLDRRA
jgi:hypothetical protein